jgi:hypothetical protein
MEVMHTEGDGLILLLLYLTIISLVAAACSANTQQVAVPREPLGKGSLTGWDGDWHTKGWAEEAIRVQRQGEPASQGTTATNNNTTIIPSSQVPLWKTKEYDPIESRHHHTSFLKGLALLPCAPKHEPTKAWQRVQQWLQLDAQAARKPDV